MDSHIHTGAMAAIASAHLMSERAKRQPRYRQREPAGKRVGRNQPCPCGSGVKFKKCCDAKRRAEEAEYKAAQARRTVPRPKLSSEDMTFDIETTKDSVLTAMTNAGMPPELVYAYEVTGMLITPMNEAAHSQEDIDAWNAAITEYKENHEEATDDSAGATSEAVDAT